MRRALVLFLLATGASLFLMLVGGCNDHPLNEVEYDHWTGQAPGTESESSSSDSSTSYIGSEGGSESSSTGEESDTGEDESTTGDVGPECGNGIVEPPELCDDGIDNGPYPAPCNEECLPNGPQ